MHRPGSPPPSGHMRIFLSTVLFPAGWYPLSDFDKKAPIFGIVSSAERVPSSTTYTTSLPSYPSRTQFRMFIRSFAAIVLILPALAGAIGILRPNSAITSTNGIPPTTGTQATTIDQCNTGPIQCCNSVQSVSHFATVLLCQPHTFF